MRATFALAALAGLITLTNAQLYSTGPFDPELGFASDSVAGQANNQRLAEAFVLTSTSSLSSVSWWGRSEGAFFPDLRNMATFTIAIFEDAGAIPGAQRFQSTVTLSATSPSVVGTDSSNNNLYQFSFNLGGLNLQRGTYWLSVGTQNVDPNGDGFYWLASQNRISGSFAADSGVSSNWGNAGFADLALTVDGAPVPEPSAIAGLGLGLIALARKRRKNP